VPPGVHFVPGHPVAGIELSGPEPGFAELFAGRWCILIPLPETASEAVTGVATKAIFPVDRRGVVTRPARCRSGGLRVARFPPSRLMNPHHRNAYHVVSIIPATA
jgi:hypothetical protein